MTNNKRALISLLSTLLVLGSSFAYVTSVHAPAVLSTGQQGVLTAISLNLTQGNGAVTVKGPQQVGGSTLQSAQIAANYASRYLGLTENNYNFTYSIDSSANVSGPSAGLAFTLLAVSGLRKQQLYGNFTVTGTIDQNGNVGQVGGIYDKISAASRYGIRYALVPYVQSSDPEHMTYYITQQLFNVPLVEVSNLSQALPYMLPSGLSSVRPLQINITGNYYLNKLPQANVTCSQCNTTYFKTLTNYTFNFTRAEINSVGKNFTALKQNLLGQLGNYSSIAGRGYLYTGANLAFLEYSKAFVLANTRNLTVGNAVGLIQNASAYCSYLTPPALTTLNYEYVIGGELRQTWASVNIQSAQRLLNQSQTTDDVIGTLSTVASSYAWCKAAQEMYGIAASIGGNYVATSPQVKLAALKAINNANGFGNNIWIQSARQDYNSSEYAAALYGATYASVFANPSASSLSSQQAANATMAYALNATFGVWPSQFAASALFSLDEAMLHGGNEQSNITSAYTTAYLALQLSNKNRLIAGSFLPVNTTGSQAALLSILSNQTLALTAIQGQISQLYGLLLILVIIIIMIGIALLIALIKLHSLTERGKRRNRNG